MQTYHDRCIRAPRVSQAINFSPFLVPLGRTTPSMNLITNTDTLLTIDSMPLYIVECAKETLCVWTSDVANDAGPPVHWEARMGGPNSPFIGLTYLRGNVMVAMFHKHDKHVS